MLFFFNIFYNRTNKAAITVFENRELKAVVVPIEDLEVLLEEMDRDKF